MWCNSAAAMAGLRQIILCVLLLTLSKNIQGIESETEANEGREEELVQSESKDGKLEIIKRIKKINEDGSYTIGYEADDGSFKIESRDVLGNIKGTYGFLDDGGQIKRVSYSTSNSSEIIAKPESTSVVQRIPNKNRNISTRRPTSTQSTPSTTSSTVIQSIARRRTSTSTTTTQKPNYSDVINVSSRMTTKSPHEIMYTSTGPRILLQSKPSTNPTSSSQVQTIKSEGQLVRPEIITIKPTQLPLLRRLDFKQLDVDKPVNEELETDKGNILRRQLPQDNRQTLNIRDHIYNLQQSLGQDSTDVYSASVTTGTPRPLFTTTSKPRTVLISSTTPPPESVPRPTIRYPVSYQRNIPQTLERNIPEYTQETTTVQSVGVRSTSAPLPVVQIPANRGEGQEPLVAIRHPSQRATVLVPLSHLQGRIVPVEDMREVNVLQDQYDSSQDQYYKETTRPGLVEIEQQRAVVRRLPPPSLGPIPVQVDENGYIREIHRQVTSPYSVPIPVPITPTPKYVSDDIDNSIDNIQPPVSTSDFQKLLQELITRQSRLEKINALSKQAEFYLQQQQRYRPVLSQPPPYFVQREPVSRPNSPIQFIHQRPGQNNPRQMISPRQYFEITRDPQQQQTGLRSKPQSIYQEQYDAQAYRPNRRVARLLPSDAQNQQHRDEQYLPPEIREMLLLRMLQLAINPALKLDDGDVEIVTEASQFKRMPVRNVEILGEEPEPAKRMQESNKRYRESSKDYE